MKKPVTKDALEIEVVDFGPIVEAKVDLRPLTVFIGPSNTGKSYLAILIYALHWVFCGEVRFGRRRFSRIFPFLSDRDDSQDLSKVSVDALLKVAHSLADDSKFLAQGSIAFPPLAADALRLRFDELADPLSSEIGRSFGIAESRALIRRGKASTSRVVLRRRVSDWAGLAEYSLSLTHKSEFRAMVPAEVRIPVVSETEDGMRQFLRRQMRHLGDAERDKYFRKLAPEFLTWLGAIVLPSFVGPLHLPAYYLPADRTGVMHMHSVVVSALIANAPAAGLRPAANTPMLSGVLADFLEQLIEIGQTGRPRRNPKRDLGSSIEDDILDGSVRVERSTLINYPHFAYRPRGWRDDLALANASSMVSELAPVVLYLRHVIEPGNVLIIEEPESHLHPAMQVEFTRQLARLVEAGVRVIVTTHSEWLVDELANIVRRSKLSRADRGDGIALHPDQVGAWLFEPKRRPKGSVVREIRLDDSGMYPSGYDEVASALHNEWAEITSRIEAGS